MARRKAGQFYGAVMVTDSDAAESTEGLVLLHCGQGHSPHHSTPPPLPHPSPGPRKRNLAATAGVNHAH